MDLCTFDPNGVGVTNGCFLGLSYPLEAVQIVFLPVSWDVTTTSGKGAAQGPAAILEASYQLEYHDFDLPRAWQIGHGTLPIDPEIQTQNTPISR